MILLITGGAGFIGSALIRFIIKNTTWQVINIDKLSYASNLSSLSSVSKNSRYEFHQIDLCDYDAISNIFFKTQPDAVMHLAAESHVDRSIKTPKNFIDSNIIGTYNLLEISREYWSNLPIERKDSFRFQHISTDEVFGDLSLNGEPFKETNAYKPSSPYSATKAASDHLVRAWQRTYGLPTLISNCSNNYGPFQYPEKLIPLTILNTLHRKPIQIYGDGSQIRDWLHVDDHVQALLAILQFGIIGETYNVGGLNEKRNIDVILEMCSVLDELLCLDTIHSSKNLIQFVTDRPGHDKRYAIDSNKISHELNWYPLIEFSKGLKSTIEWYINNPSWFSKKIIEKDVVV